MTGIFFLMSSYWRRPVSSGLGLIGKVTPYCYVLYFELLSSLVVAGAYLQRRWIAAHGSNDGVSFFYVVILADASIQWLVLIGKVTPYWHVLYFGLLSRLVVAGTYLRSCWIASHGRNDGVSFFYLVILAAASI
jgi:hypothetical protein